MQLSGRNFFTLLPVCSIMAFQLVLNHLNNSITFFSSSNSDLSPPNRILLCTHFPQSLHTLLRIRLPSHTLLILSPSFSSHHPTVSSPITSSHPLRSLVQLRLSLANQLSWIIVCVNLKQAIESSEERTSAEEMPS